MAEVQNHSNNTSGIKLFGKTIAVQQVRYAKEEQNKTDQTVNKKSDEVIPCPRCRSMDTKFCYFNNYNVNQPRHYCKGCQRYWTAGGTLRNVPVGAGRRKAKPQCRGFASFSVGCLYDAPALHQFDPAVAKDWQPAEHGVFQCVFPAKRRRSCSSDQTTC